MIIKIGNRQVDARAILEVRIVRTNSSELLMWGSGGGLIALLLYGLVVRPNLAAWSKAVGRSLGVDAVTASWLLLGVALAAAVIGFFLPRLLIEARYGVQVSQTNAPDLVFDVLSERDARDLAKRLSDLQRQAAA